MINVEMIKTKSNVNKIITAIVSVIGLFVVILLIVYLFLIFVVGSPLPLFLEKDLSYPLESQDSINTREFNLPLGNCEKVLDDKIIFILKDDLIFPTVYNYTSSDIMWNCHRGGLYIGENVKYVYCIYDDPCTQNIINDINEGYVRYRLRSGFKILEESDYLFEGLSSKKAITQLEGCAIEKGSYQNFGDCISLKNSINLNK